MKTTVLIIFVLVFDLFAQTSNSNIGDYKAGEFDLFTKDSYQSPMDFNYNLELFPNQIFTGRYYYWTIGSPGTANMQLQSPVPWLTLSSNTFTSTSCSDIQFVEYDFIAPSTPGTHNAVIQDLNGNWQNTNVQLTVTETPSSAQVFNYQVNVGQTISKTDTLRWNGFGQVGCNSNYIPGTTRNFKFNVRNPVSWFSISPTELTIPLGGIDTIVSSVTGLSAGNDFVYLLQESQYAARCFFYRIELNTITNVEDEDGTPKEYFLKQNYPNPFNPSTRISWQSPVGSHQTLKVYDVLGNEVATLVDEFRPAGIYNVQFTMNNLSSGIYFYRLEAGSFVETRKMIYLK
jgi:hypothetical protein